MVDDRQCTDAFDVRIKDVFEPFTGEVECPHCKSKQQFLMHPFVNIRKEPELKHQVMDGSIFDMECKQCGEVTRVGYLMFYYDPEKRLLFYICDGEHTEQAFAVLALLQKQEDWKAALEGCRIRAFTEPPQLGEAIVIFDHDLDDRVIALMKAIIRVCETEKNRGMADAQIRLIEMDGPHFLLMPPDDGLPEIAGFDRPSYDHLREEYSPFFPTGLRSNLVVNEEWAAHLLMPSSTLQ